MRLLKRQQTILRNTAVGRDLKINVDAIKINMKKGLKKSSHTGQKTNRGQKSDTQVEKSVVDAKVTNMHGNTAS